MTDVVRIVRVSEIVPHAMEFEWKIRNFSAQDLLEGALNSPSFQCCGADFHLEVSRKSANIALQLVQSPPDDPPQILSCLIGFNYADLVDWDYADFDEPVNHTEDIFHSISVHTLEKDCVANNVLSVECQMTASFLKHTVDDQPVTLTASNEKKQSSKQGYTTLSENLRRILEDSRLADVTLRMGQHSFQAHKAILSSRSKVFEGMFQSGMKEDQESVVEMVEMEPSTVKGMLNYIYSGTIGELSGLEAIELYVGADRYDLQELKGWCRELILEHISPDFVCRVAMLADLHSDEELAKASKRVFKENSKTIIASESWREFGKKNPAVKTDLLESVLLSLL